ncbi:hypothetical protein T03_602 [Trichinella britovi]|uniref:Uncharacterized protein n=1 Tax=Trichinella britovi TaxID=45882 RepID=A0A0V1CQL0_TRIBR|nr:hypothetical protein T03_602 [Trichinella britovi]
MLWQIESTYKLVFATTKDLRLLREIKTWGMDGIFKADYFLNTQTQDRYFYFCQTVHRKVRKWGLKCGYISENETKKLNAPSHHFPPCTATQQKSDLKQTQALQTTPTPGDATVGDIRRVSSIYDKKQCRVIQYTGKHTNGRLTIEQLLEALMYTTPESI